MVVIAHTLGSIKTSDGGPPRSVTGLCKALQTKGLEVWLISQHREGEEFVDITKIENQIVKKVRNKFLEALGVKVLIGLISLGSEKKIDIVHDHGLWLPNNLLVYLYCKWKNIPMVIHVRGMLEEWSIGEKKTKKKIALCLYQKRILENAKLLVATSEMEKRNIRKIIKRTPVVVIPNAVDLVQKKPLAFNERELTIAYISRLHPKKGLENLIEALSELYLRDWRVNIYGPGEALYIQKIKEKIGEFNLGEHVFVYPEVDEYQRDEILASSRYLVLPSFSENFGLIVAESLAFGTPVITTHGTPWSCLEEYNAGWWVSPTPNALKSAIENAITIDKNLYERMSISASNLAINFGWNKLACRMKEEYLEIKRNAT